ncbi:MAG: toxin-activating lysine-acyltransferase [Pseudomonadota bacterium]
MTTETAEATPEQEAASPEVSAEVLEKVARVRAQVRESFGKVVMAMMALPRYRNQSLSDLQHLVLEPLIRDRIAIAYPATKERGPLTDISGLAIWASVSDEVDAKIREQIKAGTFPVKLKAEDWTSGENNWLLDVIAPDQKSTVSVLSNFKQIVQKGDLSLHPVIARLVDRETLEKMGAKA